MFVRNETPYRPVLAHGSLTDERSVLSVNVELVLRLGPRGAVEALVAHERAADDAPDIRRRPLWDGVSVTASGHVACPARPPFGVAVTVRVGAVEHAVQVVGPRLWTRASRGLVPSEPGRFERIAVSWENALGGERVLEPGYLYGSELPHPGGTVAMPQNPRGVGWYPFDHLAVGQPLPNVEDPRAPILSSTDLPAPAGIAPCPELVGLRLRAWLARVAPAEADPALLGRLLASRALELTLFVQQHAPPALVVPEVAPGTVVAVSGLEPHPIAFAVPPSPIAVTAVRGRARVELPARVRAVHVDANRGLARLTYGHGWSHAASAAPAWLRVEPAKEARVA